MAWFHCSALARSPHMPATCATGWHESQRQKLERLHGEYFLRTRVSPTNNYRENATLPGLPIARESEDEGYWRTRSDVQCLRTARSVETFILSRRALLAATRSF